MLPVPPGARIIRTFLSEQSELVWLSRRRYVLAWVAGALYLWYFAGRGWIPHDDGMLAQIAERIAGGELPHRDFDDPYTGGLGYMHALAFLAFGDRILSLRILVLLAALAWMPAVFHVARRFVSPAAAALVTATAVVWTLPNYFASMPSYYNLFFATWGTVALLRHVDTNASIWLVIAGLCGGVSFAIKSSGLHFVGAAILFLLYREQLEFRGIQDRSRTVFIAKGIVGLLFIAVLAALVAARPGATDFLQFFVPGTLLVAVVLSSEWAAGRGPAGERLRRITQVMSAFLFGAALPLLALLTPYVLTGSVGAWYEGVFVMPRSRFQAAMLPMPAVITMLAAVPYGLVLVAGATRLRALNQRWSTAAIAATTLIAVVAVGGGAVDTLYRFVWYSVRHLALPVVITSCLLLVNPGNGGLSRVRRQELYLLAAMAAFIPLVQIPFSAPIYYCYAAPFVLLGALAAARNSATARHWVHPVLLSGYLLFAVIWTNTDYVWTLGREHRRYQFVSTAVVPRAGISMSPDDRVQYAQLVGLIQQANRGKRYIYAGPDCPEVYFLSGTSNPTRTLYEFLRPARPSDTVRLLEQRGVDVVVINQAPWFSGPLNPTLARAFERRYPHSAVAGHFVVRWRD